jgi:hypothetical protein
MTRLYSDIAALADGSYEAPGLRERIAAAPDLAALLDEQRRAIAATRAAAPSAPASLRAALAAAAATTGRPAAAAARPRRPLLGVLVAAAGVAALGVVAVLPSHAAPSVAAVAEIAARGPSAPPPQADPGHRGALASELGGVRYPYWQDTFGWETSGTRTDRVDGRPTMTVYYADRARVTVGYTIVAGSPLPEPARAGVEQAGGTRYLGLQGGGRTIVTWRRAGHTCVISATGVPLPTLLRLAEWRYDATRA